MIGPGNRLVRQVTQWHVRSVQGSRRNALTASTSLAERRRERLEVEEFLAHRVVVQPDGTAVRPA